MKKHTESGPKRNLEWQEHIDFVLKKIAVEQVIHRDMIFLPHLDVYSRLPQKVLMTLKRLEKNFVFVLVLIIFVLSSIFILFLFWH